MTIADFSRKLKIHLLYVKCGLGCGLNVNPQLPSTHLPSPIEETKRNIPIDTIDIVGPTQQNIPFDAIHQSHPSISIDTIVSTTLADGCHVTFVWISSYSARERL